MKKLARTLDSALGRAYHTLHTRDSQSFLIHPSANLPMLQQM